MSLNPDVDSVVNFRPYPHIAEEDRPVQAPAEMPQAAQPEIGQPALTAAPVAQPGFGMTASAVAPAVHAAQQAWVAPEVAKAPRRVRGSRSWVAPVAIGVVGVLAAGTLGYFLYSTAGQRDGALRHLASTQSTLASTQSTLTSTQATLASTQQDLAARNATLTYASMYIADSGRLNTDYQKLVACSSFGSCRSSAQSTLSDLQAFQSDRSSTSAPAAAASSDGMLRDALSAAIAADQEVISGMDNFNVNKFNDGVKKLNAAMLSLAKAEAALGPELK